MQNQPYFEFTELLFFKEKLYILGKMFIPLSGIMGVEAKVSFNCPWAIKILLTLESPYTLTHKG